MTLEEIRNVPFIEKKSLVTEACLLYRKLKVTGEYFKPELSKVSDVVKAKNLLDIKSISMFEVILGLLEKSHLQIIENEFINFETMPSNWYENEYSKGTYYRLKHDAIDRFLFLLFA